MSKKNGTGKFIFGAALGTLAGVLLAPNSGKESRRAIKKYASDLLDKIKDIDANEVKENITNKVNELVEEIKDLDKEKVKEIAVKKAKDIKNNAEELVRYVKDKATPYAQEAADALRQKAIETTKKVLEQLENE